LTGVAIGYLAGHFFQKQAAVAIGYNTATSNQGVRAIAVGDAAGYTSQGSDGVAIGTNAGASSQGNGGVAIGYEAGYTGQFGYNVAIGYQTGSNTQGNGGVAIGYQAGYSNQGVAGNAGIAIGVGAGESNQGEYSIAIGWVAGRISQPANSIVLNAQTNTALNPATTGFFVAPVRSVANANPVSFNTSTNEFTYSAYSPLPLSNITATSLTVTTETYGTYYYITDTGFDSLTLPSTAPTDTGAFWVIRNATSTYLSVTVYNNNNIISPISIPGGTSVTVAVTGAGGAAAYVLF
jgi:hypothetical protein